MGTQKISSFADARMGAVQMQTMGLKAFGAFGSHQPTHNMPMKLAASVSDSQGVPFPPAAVLRPGSSHEADLSARLLNSPRNPWETYAHMPATPSVAMPMQRGASHGDESSFMMPPSPRRPRGPPAYTRPPTRGDAMGLTNKLQATLSRGGRPVELDAAWHSTFLELVRQVYVHCSERGQLLDAVRVHLESELRDTRKRCVELARELARLKRDADMLRGGSSLPTQGTSADAQTERAAEEQRIGMLTDAASNLSPKGRGELLARIVAVSEDDAIREPLLDSALMAVPVTDRLKVLGSQLDSLAVGDLMRVLSKVLGKVQKGHRQLLLNLLTDSLDDAEKARHVLEVSKALSSDARATTAKALLTNLSKLTRRPAVASLLRGLSKDERIELTFDVISMIPLSDLIQIINQRCAAMDSSTRVGFASEVIGTISSKERAQLVEEQLVKLPTDERETLLGKLFGMLTQGQREALQEMLQRTMCAGDR